MEFLTEEELRAAIKHELGHYIISFTKTDSYEDFSIELYLSNKFSSGNYLMKTGVSHTDNLYISAAGSVSEVLKDDEINPDVIILCCDEKGNSYVSKEVLGDIIWTKFCDLGMYYSNWQGRKVIWARHPLLSSKEWRVCFKNVHSSILQVGN